MATVKQVQAKQTNIANLAFPVVGNRYFVLYAIESL